MIDPEDGALTADDPSFWIGPALTRSAFTAADWARGAHTVVSNEPWHSFKLDGLYCEESLSFSVSLYFHGEHLVQIELASSDGKSGRSWADYSAAEERQCKEGHDAWLNACLGERRSFAWGTVQSDDGEGDPHGPAGATITITYAAFPGRPQPASAVPPGAASPVAPPPAHLPPPPPEGSAALVGDRRLVCALRHFAVHCRLRPRRDRGHTMAADAPDRDRVRYADRRRGGFDRCRRRPEGRRRSCRRLPMRGPNLLRRVIGVAAGASNAFRELEYVRRPGRGRQPGQADRLDGSDGRDPRWRRRALPVGRSAAAPRAAPPGSQRGALRQYPHERPDRRGTGRGKISSRCCAYPI